MYILRRIYSIWCAFWFIVPLIIFYPFFLLFDKLNAQSIVFLLKRSWARIYLICVFIPLTIKNRHLLKKDQKYVYCANHCSYLDIVTMGIVAKGKYAFVSKKELQKIPLFGSILKRFHILVERGNKESGQQALEAMNEAVEKGKSVIIYPEGGIKTKYPPFMTLFRDGAFKVAIQNKIPIAPVAILHNWKILDKKLVPRWHKMKAVVLPPIETFNYSLEDIEILKKKVYESITHTLKDHYPEKYKKYEKEIEAAY